MSEYLPAIVLFIGVFYLGFSWIKRGDELDRWREIGRAIQNDLRSVKSWPLTPWEENVLWCVERVLYPKGHAPRVPMKYKKTTPTE